MFFSLSLQIYSPPFLLWFPLQETVCCHQQAVAPCASCLDWAAQSPHHSWEEEEWGEIIHFLGSLAVNLPWVNCVLSQMPRLLSSFWDHLFISYSLFQLPVTPPSLCPCRPKGGNNWVAPILRSLLLFLGPCLLLHSFLHSTCCFCCLVAKSCLTLVTPCIVPRQAPLS